MKPRSTRQLTATYDVLAASTDHPTADQILLRVRRQMPRISLGTIYRNLEKLRAEGRLRVVRLAGGVAHYDAMIDQHDHFVCESCGDVTDLEGEAPLSRPVTLEDRGYVVRWQTTALYGVCAACRGAGRASPSSS